MHGRMSFLLKRSSEKYVARVADAPSTHGRELHTGDSTAYGFTADYPNDAWDINLIYKRIGRDFDPSLGFVPRRAVYIPGRRRVI